MPELPELPPLLDTGPDGDDSDNNSGNDGLDDDAPKLTTQSRHAEVVLATAMAKATIGEGPQTIDQKMQYAWQEDLINDEKLTCLQSCTNQLSGKLLVSSCACDESPSLATDAASNLVTAPKFSVSIEPIPVSIPKRVQWSDKTDSAAGIASVPMTSHLPAHMAIMASPSRGKPLVGILDQCPKYSTVVSTSPMEVASPAPLVGIGFPPMSATIEVAMAPPVSTGSIQPDPYMVACATSPIEVASALPVGSRTVPNLLLGPGGFSRHPLSSVLKSIRSRQASQTLKPSFSF